MTSHAPASAIAKAWTAALKLWGVNIALSPPQAWEPTDQRPLGVIDSKDPIAYIDMNLRQVVVNFAMLAHMQATDALEAVLAHEIGHHIAFPHTLGLMAQLEILEGQLLPGAQSSLLNLFFDLQVNEFVGRTLSEQLCSIYIGHRDAFESKPPSSMFDFYLACYEELWGKPPGTLVTTHRLGAMENLFAGWRGEARMFVQTFYALPDIYLQFIYFCSVFIRYLPPPDQPMGNFALSNDLPKPDIDDYAGALYGSPSIDEALKQAKARGMLPENADGRAWDSSDPLSRIDKITRHMPGTAAAPFRKALAEKHYKRLVDQYLIKIPGTKAPPPEPMLPTTTEEWEFGDNPKLIDWNQSVLARGAMAAVAPLRREYEAEDPKERGKTVPGIEIYLDTSGSMPNPATALNAMTLAAQILAAAAIRKGGRVRAVIYSYGNPKVSDWMLSEQTAREFLLHYAGGGTLFPFDVLQNFAAKPEEIIRVIISDSDFLGNVGAAGAMTMLVNAIDNSELMVALFAVYRGGEDFFLKALAPAKARPKFRFVPVTDLNGFGRVAADLSDALFGK